VRLAEVGVRSELEDKVAESLGDRERLLAVLERAPVVAHVTEVVGEQR